MRAFVAIQPAPLHIRLPLTMYRQIEKMSIHSLDILPRVHKYNAKSEKNTHKRLLAGTRKHTSFCAPSPMKSGLKQGLPTTCCGHPRPPPLFRKYLCGQRSLVQIRLLKKEAASKRAYVHMHMQGTQWLQTRLSIKMYSFLKRLPILKVWSRPSRLYR